MATYRPWQDRVEYQRTYQRPVTELDYPQHPPQSPGEIGYSRCYRWPDLWISITIYTFVSTYCLHPRSSEQAKKSEWNTVMKVDERTDPVILALVEATRKDVQKWLTQTEEELNPEETAEILRPGPTDRTLNNDRHSNTGRIPQTDPQPTEDLEDLIKDMERKI